MTAQQYRAAIHKLGLNVLAAGRMLGVSPRTAQHYAAGTTRVPGPVAKLLRLLLALQAHGIDPDKLD